MVWGVLGWFGVFPQTGVCQKSLAIRTDWGSFQIILACFAFTAILGHYTAYILKK